ncbi:hypothetical protein KY329_03195 [Candidatus Woesearchaeota archaeon]|nr:hypothetical protein [Candidatus Woesearchaeota archaeon]
MQDEHRGMALVVMGITAIVGVIGLVLMFSGGENSAGMLMTSATDGSAICPKTPFGEPQYTPVLAGPKEDMNFLDQYVKAGYHCIPSDSVDEFGYGTWCCTNPTVQSDAVNPQVNPRGPTPLDTRKGFGAQVGQSYPADAEKEYPASPRLGP